MDYSLIISRLGTQIRQKRINRGLTQVQLAKLAGLTRQKVIAVEKGTLTVGMIAFARVLAALDSELSVIPAAMPTLEELEGLFD
ncbi:helix-turn-helix domain-containing protein [Pseudomonas arsenicoxydans]|uniref:Helix-turn-helix domain-containing protein n=1 Tax=Pseudomonas arsenicoxydans TaxID=702115 RepID=A0A502I3B5_9PSED|nr:helix-turn-helix domain-containing protein [Pseudomonas arsenicoxydans]TPG81361.1 helix-turn-helix domain-containing protein [Pseudomonas arsenicoxydans]